MKPNSASIPAFTAYQKFVVAILAFLQFTIILDFMILSPLGAMLMPALQINPSQFGLVVSVYAFSAGTSGLLAAGFADRFDRKKLLLFFYAGFLLGTFLCGIAPTYHFLLAARMITGIFGGVMGSIVMAITTDLFSFQMRGRVMGFIQTSFAASQILGIPMGLFLANHFGWHMPFLMIVGIGLAMGLVILNYLKPINEHLKLKVDHSAFHHFKTTLTNSRYLIAFGATALLSIGGFMLMPFSSAFTVNNIGISIEKLPMIYFITGLCAIFIGPLVGKLSDRFGKYNVFVAGSLLSVVMIFIYTNLGVTPLPWVILVNVILFAGIFTRMIPSQALMSAVPAPSSRGSFMSVSSSLQQIAGGFASMLAGLIVSRGPDGKIEHFERVGYVMFGTISISIVLMYFIHRMVREDNREQTQKTQQK